MISGSLAETNNPYISQMEDTYTYKYPYRYYYLINHKLPILSVRLMIPNSTHGSNENITWSADVEKNNDLN